MKVLFSITYYCPYVSGLTIYVKRMAEELVKRGHQVKVICFQNDRLLPITEILNGVEIIRVKPDIQISKGYLGIRWITQCLSMIKDVDSIVVNLPQFEGFITAIIAKIYHKKLICVYHCEIKLPNGLINKVIQKLLEGANILSLMLCSSTIVYTQDYASHSNILQPFIKKVIPIYPPIPPPKIDLSVKKRLDKFIGKQDLTIGVSARLAKEKGIEYLIRIIPQVRSKVKIVIAGPVSPVGEKKYQTEIMKLVSRYQENIVWLGTLSQMEIGAFYSLIDLLVLPSINSTEAFGMVQVEAMMCGTPVIASDLPGVRIPIQKTGMGIIVPIKNSQAIADAIVKIKTDLNKYIIPKCQIVSEFDFDNVVDEFIKVISI
jgi:glycosyltransferase involved in cell wall biosynthesis